MGDSKKWFKEKENKEKVVIKKRKIPVLSIAIVVAVLALMVSFGSSKIRSITKEDVVSTAQLEKAINISNLSSAEFVYNGIADKYDEEDNSEVVCHIAYESTVKVGIQMEQIKFDIDKENKTITPILPDISVNIAEVDPNQISYIPKDPSIGMSEVITICKEDAMAEANASGELRTIAKENLQATVEALLSPLLKSSEYTIKWEDETEEKTAESTAQQES